MYNGLGSNILFWDGISNLAFPSQIQQLQNWMAKIKQSNPDIYIHSFSGKVTEVYSTERPITVAFSFLENNVHQILILHIEKPYSFQIFYFSCFQILKAYLCDKHKCKYVYDHEKGIEISQIFMRYFQICVTGMKCVVKNKKPWNELLDGNMLRRKYDYFKSLNKNEIFYNSIETLLLPVTSEQYLTKSEKDLACDVITAIFQLFSELREPENANPHVVLPGNSKFYTPYRQPPIKPNPPFPNPQQQGMPPPSQNYPMLPPGQYPPPPPPYPPYPPKQFHPPPPLPPHQYYPPQFFPPPPPNNQQIPPSFPMPPPPPHPNQPYPLPPQHPYQQGPPRTYPHSQPPSNQQNKTYNQFK